MPYYTHVIIWANSPFCILFYFLPAPSFSLSLRCCFWEDETIIVKHTWFAQRINYVGSYLLVPWITYTLTQSAIGCRARCLVLAAPAVLDFSVSIFYSTHSLLLTGALVLSRCTLWSWLWLVWCWGCRPFHVCVHSSRLSKPAGSILSIAAVGSRQVGHVGEIPEELNLRNDIVLCRFKRKLRSGSAYPSTIHADCQKYNTGCGAITCKISVMYFIHVCLW